MLKNKLYFISVLLLSACSQPQTHIPNYNSSFEVIGTDTCNRSDDKGLRQGKWYIYEYSSHRRVIKDTVFYNNGVVLKNR